MNESDHYNGYHEPDVVEKVPEEETVVETHGVFSGSQPQNAYDQTSGYNGQNIYGSQAGAFGTQNFYGSQTDGYGAQNAYGSQAGGYGTQNSYGTQNAYGEQNPYEKQTGGYGAQNLYGNQAGGYGGQNPYGNQAGGYGGQNPYGNQAGGYGAQNPYGVQAGGYGAQNPYGVQAGGYGAQNPYGNQAGGYGTQNPYGTQTGGFGGQPPYDNLYSPYAAPQKKQSTWLIVGIVAVLVILFVVAVIALASRAAKLLSEKDRDMERSRRDVYDMDDYDYYDNDYYDDDYDRHDYNHHAYDYDYDTDDYYYDYDYDHGYSYNEDTYDYDNEKYYTLHDDIREDLSYSVEFAEYEYETDYNNVYIGAYIPTVLGDDVPNLGALNESIQNEVETVTAFFEKEIEQYIKDEENSFNAALSCYVTYMDEDKLSIVYDERLYYILGDVTTVSATLVCFNVDMKNGVVLDNKEILLADDDFSVEFRKKSDEQNGEIEYLTAKTDQQITEYFKSDNIIVFYTPKGMEIGFNYEEGWVTATYEEYEKYLKVF